MHRFCHHWGKMWVSRDTTPTDTPSTMEVVEGKKTELKQKIADTYKGSIDYEYKFHIDVLTADRLQWSFTYRNGHSDTWEFSRKAK